MDPTSACIVPTSLAAARDRRCRTEALRCCSCVQAPRARLSTARANFSHMDDGRTDEHRIADARVSVHDLIVEVRRLLQNETSRSLTTCCACSSGEVH